MNLIVKLPTRDTPGFLKRSKMALTFQSRLQAKAIDQTVFDDMVEFLLPLVTEPADRDEARSALWDASQSQFEEMMAALSGTANPTKADSPQPVES